MNDGQLDTKLNSYFDDLKQFFAATVSQSEIRLEAALNERIESFETRLTARINAVENRLEQKMDDGFAGIADIMENHNNRLDNHEERLVRLEVPSAAA